MFNEEMEKFISQPESIINNSKKRWSAIQGIYFLINKSDIVYVGQSLEIIHRISKHLKDEIIVFDRYSFIRCPNEILNNLEAYYVYTFKPKFNLVLPTNKYYKSIDQLKREIFNLPVPVLKYWISFCEIEDNTRGYYCVKKFFGLYEFKEWMTQMYGNISIKNCSVSYIREFSQNIKRK